MVLSAAALSASPQTAPAQNLEEIFHKVSPTVVVVRATGRDVGAAETSAHVVNRMDEISFAPRSSRRTRPPTSRSSISSA